MSIWVKCDVSAGGALTERGRVEGLRTPWRWNEEYHKGYGTFLWHDRASWNILRRGQMDFSPLGAAGSY